METITKKMKPQRLFAVVFWQHLAELAINCYNWQVRHKTNRCTPARTLWLQDKTLAQITATINYWCRNLENGTMIKPNSVDQKYICYPYCTLCLMSESHLNIFGRIALKQFMRLFFSCGYVTLPSGTGKVSHIITVFGPYLLCRVLVTLPDPCRL